MQGLPVDELLLTRETEDQLADLAGNAMSTTVVGACIMAALVVGRKYLKQGDSTESYKEIKAGKCTNIEDADESQSGSECMPSTAARDAGPGRKGDCEGGGGRGLGGGEGPGSRWRSERKARDGETRPGLT